MTWLWIGGAIVLVAGALVPPWLIRAQARRGAYAVARDRAHAAMSRLELAIDLRRGPDGSGDAAGDVDPALATARRHYTLAGAALAGPDTVEGFRRAEEWARQGLAALGEAE